MDQIQMTSEQQKQNEHMKMEPPKSILHAAEQMERPVEITKTGSSILDQMNALPTECCVMEQQLQREVEVAGKLGRSAVVRSQRARRAQLLQKREDYKDFFLPVDTYLKKLTDAFEQEEAQNVHTVSDHLAASIEKLETVQLFADKREKNPKMLALCELFDQLQKIDANAVTTEQMQELSAHYEELGFEKADSVSMQYMDTEYPQSAYMILFQNVALNLFEMVNVLPKDAVNLKYLAKLYGIASASSMTVGRMCASEEFKQQLMARKEKKEREERARIKAAQTKEANLRYIRKGTGVNGKTPEQWPMEAYAETVIRLIGEGQLETLSTEEVAYRVQRMQECMESNANLIARQVIKAGAVYQLPALQESLKATVTELVGDHLFTEVCQADELQKVVEQAKQQMPQECTVYKEYYEYLQKDEVFSQIPNTYQNAQLQTYMTGESLEQFKEKIAPLREQVQVNLKILEQRISDTLVEKLCEPAKNKFLETDGAILLEGSVRQISTKIDWYLTYIREYAPEIFDQAEGLTAETYLRQADQLKEKQTEPYLFSEQLQGNAFCSWEGFDGILSGYEKDLMDCLDKALADQLFHEDYLKDVRCINDLDQLQYHEFAEFLTMLRANLGGALLDWSMIHCPMEREIRTALLPGMLDGSIKENNFLASMQQELERYETKQELQKQRRNVLFGYSDKPHGEIRFRYLDVVANTSINKEPRSVSRTRRFANAAKAIEQMKKLEPGLYGAYQARITILSGNDNLTSKAILDEVNERIEDSIKTSSGEKRESLRELKKLINAEGGCGLELVAGEYVDLFLQDELFRRSFTADKREVYEQSLTEKIRRYRKRHEQVVRRYGDYEIAKTVREALSGLEDLDQDAGARKERNLAKYGVESFEALLDALDEYLGTDAKTQKKSKTETAMQKEARETVARYKTRLEQIQELHGGLYQQLIPLMEEDTGIFEALTLLPDAAFGAFLQKLDARLLEPMKLLGKSYGIESGFTKQALLEYGPAMIMGNIPKAGWKDTFSRYYARISDYVIGKHSISSTFRDIVNQQEDLAPYLISILLDQKYGSMLLANRMEWKRVSEDYRVRISANEASLKKAVGDGNDYASIARFLLSSIAMESKEEFLANLPARLEAYRRQTEETRRDTERAARVLESQRSVLLQAEMKKQKGKEADAKDRGILQSMKHGRECLTPVLMTYQKDGQPVPGVAAVQKAKKQVEAALGEQMEQMPKVLADLLTERVLAGDRDMKKVQIREEADRLVRIYHKISLDEFGRENAQLPAQMQESFLTYLYCQEKQLQSEEWQRNEDECMQAGFRSFIAAQKLLTGVRSLDVKGKVASKEKEELLQAVQAALYTMPEEQLREFVSRRSRYVARLDQIEPICEQAAKEYCEHPAQQQALKLGLLAYYREELMGEDQINMGELTGQIATLLQDEKVRQYLSQTKAQLFASTGSDALTADEQLTDTFLTREQFEEALGELLTDDARKKYNGLSLQQRKIFALALNVPGMHTAVSELRGYQLFRQEADERGELAVINGQVQRYIHHDLFEPQIDYAKALERLQTGKRQLNEHTFEEAMTFTQMVENSRQEQYEPDLTRLRDAKSLIEAANIAAPVDAPARTQKVSDRITSTERFFEQLELSDDEKEQKIKKRLQMMKDNKQAVWRLIQVLQDRTVIDLSTTVGVWGRAQGEVTPFVNEGKRLAMLERAEKGTDLSEGSLTSVHLEQAMNTLLSYQLRNDIPIVHKVLTSKDFAGGALERKTVVDWKLLERALDLVDEMNRAQTRLNAMKQAPKLILQGKNEKAKAEYTRHQETGTKVDTEEAFEAFFEEMAKKEGQTPLLTGYRMLSKEDRTLFIRALGSRWVLDVSKEHIMANRFGMIDRDYADPAGRDELCNEYFANALSVQPGVALSEQAYEEAFAGMLSAQVNDAVDYTQIRNADLSVNLSSGAQLFGPARTTAVDWKLVMRALQLVHRCSNESEIYAGDRELYVSQGDLSETGQFQFDSAYLRRNLHSAGNRLTRYFGRRVAANVKEKLPGPLVMIVRGAVPVNVNNALAQYAAFASEEEEKGFVGSVAEKADTLDSLMNDTIGENAKKYGVFTEGFQESFEEWGEKLGDFSTAVSYLSDTLDIIEAFSNKRKLGKAADSAKEADAEDEVRMREAAEHQTTEQAQRSRQAKERNVLLQGQAKTKASERQTDAIIDSVASIVGNALGEVFEDQADLISTAVTEAGKFINMVRSYCNDKSSVREYFEKRGEISRLKDAMEKESPGSFHEEDSLELIRQARGYENYTEMASFVGLNVTRSLLFCASPFNRQESLRIVALATLGVLGMEDVIGNCDNQSAERVYEAIMGGEYR